jgi:predicted ArsR family transcriptional regulator
MHEKAMTRWSSDEDERLLVFLQNGGTIQEAAKSHGRSQEAVRRHLQDLNGHKPKPRKPIVRRRYATDFMS